MTSVDVNVASWLGRGQQANLRLAEVRALLQGINDKLVAADQRLTDARGMTGIGYRNKIDEITNFCESLDILSGYVSNLPDDLSSRLDHELFLAFRSGPTESLSKIHMDEFTTGNTLGVTGTTTMNGPGAPPQVVTSPLTALSFNDFLGNGPDGANVPEFEDIFTLTYESWLTDPDHEEDMDLDQFITSVLESGEYDHQAYHPVKDFLSTVLDFAGVGLLLKGITGHDVVTGEDLYLSGEEQAFDAVMGLATLASWAVVIPSGGASLTGVAFAKAGLAALGREIIINVLATSANWATTLLSLGIGLTISVVGTKYVIQRLNPGGLPPTTLTEVDMPKSEDGLFPLVAASTRDKTAKLTDEAARGLTPTSTIAEIDIPSVKLPPGRSPASVPVAGDADRGVGAWVTVKRNSNGAAYQEHVTGVPRNPDGSTTEYRLAYSPARDTQQPYVDFDGHVWRGDPPTEFLLDAKDGYSTPLIDRPWPEAQEGQLERFSMEAIRQLDAVEQSGSTARIEWHFSNEECATIVREYFDNEDIEISVIYTP